MSTANTTDAAPEPIIEARQLEKHYPQADGSRIQVIAPIDLAIYPGQIIALLGASGCGKSTLMRMLTGLSPATGGAVYWHGQPVDGRFRNVSLSSRVSRSFPGLRSLKTSKLRSKPAASLPLSVASALCASWTPSGWTVSSR